MTNDEEQKRHEQVLKEAKEAAQRAQADSVPGLRPDERKKIARTEFDPEQVAKTIEKRGG